MLAAFRAALRAAGSFGAQTARRARLLEREAKAPNKYRPRAGGKNPFTTRAKKYESSRRETSLLGYGPGFRRPRVNPIYIRKKNVAVGSEGRPNQPKSPILRFGQARAFCALRVPELNLKRSAGAGLCA